jgi:AcrR family transcriptional regulator
MKENEMPNPTFFNLPEEKRQKLLEYAIDEFANHDYHSASVSKIVSRVGIAKGSLYQYFKDKQDLFNYLLVLAAQKKAEMFSTYSNQASDITWDERLVNLFQVMASYELRYPQLSKIGFRATIGNSPLPEEILLKAKQSTSQYFQELVEEGKRRGEIRPDVDSSIAVLIFSSTLAGLGDYVKSHSRVDLKDIDLTKKKLVQELGLENVFNQIITILKNGISN